MKKRRNLKKKNSITKKSYFNVSHINLAHSSVNLSQTNMKNSILSLKYLENNIKNHKIKNRRKKSKPLNLFENLNNVYKNNFSRKNSIRRNLDNYQHLKNSKKNLYNNFQEKKFELPKLKKKFFGEFSKSIDDYKIIFGEKENLKINLQQLKLLLSHLKIIGNVDQNWECENLKEKKFVNIIFDVLRGDNKKMDFEFLRIFLVLFNLLFEDGLAFLGFGDFQDSEEVGEKNDENEILVKSKNLMDDKNNLKIEKSEFIVNNENGGKNQNRGERKKIKIEDKKEIVENKNIKKKPENQKNYINLLFENKKVDNINNFDNKKKIDKKNINFQTKNKIDNFENQFKNKNITKKIFEEELILKKNNFSFSENFNKNKGKTENPQNIKEFKNNLILKNQKKDLKIIEIDKNSFFEESESNTESPKKIQSSIKKTRFEFDKKKKKGNSINLEFLNSSRNLKGDLKNIKKMSLYKIISEKNEFEKKNFFDSSKLKKRKSEKLFSAIINLKNEKKSIDVFKNDNIKMVVNRFSIQNRLNKDQKMKLVFLLEKKKDQCFIRKNSVF